MSMIRLSELPVGGKGIIRSFEPDEIYLKLMEMGCVPGSEVFVYQVAPLGDPISIKVAGYTLSIRKEEAAMIWIESI